ncbi:uncharacterized protein LOC116927186 isoform X2 [Daphnia magna]|uniref:uncharacterized protein LOC116927186 isoform X2 n=1 Tax=Daphnia magna TaxID=35525 RepID=UPI001E1BBCD7|nr:uncharacterized protein LOC116927186 isoform X2 [Daphnia magna]
MEVKLQFGSWFVNHWLRWGKSVDWINIIFPHSSKECWHAHSCVGTNCCMELKLQFGTWSVKRWLRWQKSMDWMNSRPFFPFYDRVLFTDRGFSFLLHTSDQGRQTKSLCRTVNLVENRRIIGDTFVKVADKTANDLNLTWDNLLLEQGVNLFFGVYYCLIFNVIISRFSLNTKLILKATTVLATNV